MSNNGWATGAPLSASADWVDDILLRGADRDVCLHFGAPVDRAALRHAVADREAVLTRLGLARGGSVALQLPPSLAYVANLLAAWRIGAQVALLDHRLTPFETERALDRLAPQVLVGHTGTIPGGLRAFYDITDVATARATGRPAETHHSVIQLSSGSTGPSKVIARTAEQLVAEVDRYTRIDGVPLPGERVVLLASVVHVLGLVGGLLYCLHAGTELVLPERLTVDSILKAVAAGEAPTTLLGVPFHTELLASAVEPPKLPQLKRMTTGGELVRAEVSQKFVDRYGIILGNMYGMTEVGVIATDLYGANRPSLMPAPGLAVREQDGQLLVSAPESPYIGLVDPTRWADGWLNTKDAGQVDPETGLITVLGRLDSQVSVGGLKVDLTEVEHTLAALPGVEGAVVIFDRGIEAYAVVPDPDAAAALEGELAKRLAPFKRPRELHIVAQLPRTATGKLVRDHAVLRTAE
ncbi:long-chain fatty acid--CoA ligase [Catellatospora sp. KI3]|uniref:class I adenylate-forming enzyme family protein n=1 Tax=Catellatospora sp. KI3 TaxID=3041620 RepID=UPI0024830647|nr:long-chain fatty acid--CoA ligase [Catellatospora sp. KI3]MDI1463938.1 long-chain fatty acid--CoA ligase [Catellatospora sp. KI3]